jgi:hypothetical protein
MKHKKCTGCGEVLTMDAFGKPKKRKNGSLTYNARCIPCNKAYNKAYYKKWKAKKKSTPNTKRCVSCNIIKNHKKFYGHPGRPDGLQSDCKQCASEKQRLRIFRKQNEVNEVVAPEKRCSICKKVKPADEFARARAKATGLASSCRKCFNKRRNEARMKNEITEPTVDEKYCPGCFEVLPADQFYRNKRDRTGLHTYCKECDYERKYDRRRD